MHALFDFLRRVFSVDVILFGDIFLGLLAVALIAFCVVYAAQFLFKRDFARSIVTVSIGIFVIGRFFHFGQIDGFRMSDIGIDVVLGSVLIAAAVLLPRKTKKSNASEKDLTDAPALKLSWKDIAILVVLCAIAVLQMRHIGSAAIDGDEIFQFEAAAGYVQTGVFEQYDFKTGQAFLDANGKPWLYDRAWGYTWMIAQSMNIFGISEWSARLPSVLSFIVLVMGVYVVARMWLKDRQLATIIACTFVWSNTFIQMGSLVRMYAPLFVMCGISLVCLYRVFQAYCHKRFAALLFWLLLFVPAYTAAVHLHVICLIVIPAFFFFVIIEWIVQVRAHRSLFAPHVRPLTHAMILAVLGIVLMIGVDQFHRYIPWRIIDVEFKNPIYELYAFFDFPIYGFALAVYCIGLVTMFYKTTVMRYLGLLSASMFFLFVFVIDTLPVRRYFAFVLILIIPFVVITARDLLYSIGIRNTKKIPLLTVTLVLLCVPFSFPGIPSVSVFNASVADNVETVDYRSAYNYIQERKALNDVVLATSFRNFYWGEDNETTVLDLHRNYPESLMKVDRMEKMLFTYQTGWIVWPKENPKASREVQEYVRRMSSYHSDIAYTGMNVFYFDVSGLQLADDRMVALGFPSSFKNPSLIQGQGNDKLFVFFKGEKHWISSSSVFAQCLYVRSEVKSIPRDLFESISTGDPIQTVDECVALR